MSYEETYTGEFEIKNEVGKNLFETYEVNGKQYTDNLPKNSFIGIPKQQYIEYEQQKEENKRLHSIIKGVREVLEYKRETLTSLLLSGRRCNYEELLYQLDEEIGKILDKVGDEK